MDGVSDLQVREVVRDVPELADQGVHLHCALLFGSLLKNRRGERRRERERWEGQGENVIVLKTITYNPSKLVA